LPGNGRQIRVVQSFFGEGDGYETGEWGGRTIRGMNVLGGFVGLKKNDREKDRSSGIEDNVCGRGTGLGLGRVGGGQRKHLVERGAGETYLWG